MEIQPIHPKGNQAWMFIGRTDAEAETPIVWSLDVKNWLIGKTLMLARLKAGGGWDDRGWGCWMASPIWWTWVWAGSGSWWWTRKPGVLQSLGVQRHNWATELNWFWAVQGGISLQFLSFPPTVQSLHPMDYSLPWSSVRRILQARILGWVTISSSRASSQGSNPSLLHLLH